MPIDRSQSCRVIFEDLIAQLEAYLASGPSPVPGVTVIAGGVNSLIISSLAEPVALNAAGGVNSITVTVANPTPTPTGTVIAGGTNSLTITSLEAPAALNATGGVNSISITGA